VADKPTFRAAFKARRCLIPASGYYERKHEGKAKQPYFIHPPHGLFAFAGLWDVWAKGPAAVESCSIITTTANEATRHLHERMPVILDREHFAAWLDPLTPPAGAGRVSPTRRRGRQRPQRRATTWPSTALDSRSTLPKLRTIRRGSWPGTRGRDGGVGHLEAVDVRVGHLGGDVGRTRAGLGRLVLRRVTGNWVGWVKKEK